MEQLGVAEHRRELLAGISGSVIEIGAGTGANFPHYPESVREIVAVAPEPYLRAHSHGRGRSNRAGTRGRRGR
jgi:hypothetical protein